MSLGRHGLRVFGLSLLAVVGLMAFTAAAQAADFRVNGGTFTAKGVTEESVTGAVPLGVLDVTPLNLKIHCESGDVVSAKVKKGGTATASILFLGCTVINNANCTISDKEGGVGPKMITAGGTGELKLVGSTHYLTASSASFATIWMNGAKCTLTEENVVSGSTALKLPTALTESVLQTVEDITEAEETSLGVKLFYGEEKAQILSTSGTAQLSGALSGAKWGAE